MLCSLDAISRHNEVSEEIDRRTFMISHCSKRGRANVAAVMRNVRAVNYSAATEAYF